MNENLPYEDELKKRLDDLSLPPEDLAWDDMKKRLDKDDKDRPLIPPVFKGCAGYGLLFLLLTIASLFIINPKWFHNISNRQHITNDSTGNTIPVNKNDTISTVPSAMDNAVPKSSSEGNKALSQKGITSSTLLIDTAIKTNKKKSLNKKSSDSNEHRGQNKNFTKKENTISKKQPYYTHSKKAHQVRPVKKMPGRLNATSNGNAETDSTPHKNINDMGIHQPDSIKADTANVTTKKIIKGESLKKNKTDTLAKKGQTENDSVHQRHFYFGAGLALHQLIPVAGQKSNPYNSLGRKNSLRDYIPAVYLRLYKDKKWFIQSEFRYGAPQYTKDIVFVPKKIIDTSLGTTTSESKTVKKTFYHQLPVSFNYFILPGLTAGAGITFNKFSSAIVQQDVRKSNNITLIDSLVSSGLVTQKKADSNFATTYIQALFEIQYHWKRFSAGARYSFGLQPYLEFTLPGGIQRKEKNSSLQIFIRYELWQSRRKE